MQPRAPVASSIRLLGRLMMSDVRVRKPLLQKPFCRCTLLMAQCETGKRFVTYSEVQCTTWQFDVIREFGFMPRHLHLTIPRHLCMSRLAMFAVSCWSRMIVSIRPYKVPKRAASLNKALLYLHVITWRRIPNEMHVVTVADPTVSVTMLGRLASVRTWVKVLLPARSNRNCKTSNTTMKISKWDIPGLCGDQYL